MRGKRVLRAFAAAAAVCLSVDPAFAQTEAGFGGSAEASPAGATATAYEPASNEAGFGELQPLVVSFEHLAGFSWQKLKFEGSDSNTTTEAGTFTPFVGPVGTHMRLGIHYFVAPPLSIGGLINYSDNDDLGTFLLVGARIGVAFPMTSGTAIWIRAGAAYERSTLDFGTENTYTAFLPGGELLFVLQPVDNFGFLLGGLFERTVGGKHEGEDSSGGSRERDFTRTEVALSFGIFAEF